MIEKLKEKWFEIKESRLFRFLFIPITVPLLLALLVASFFTNQKPKGEINKTNKQRIESDKHDSR